MSIKFSKQVKEIISLSREEALRLGSNCIGSEHLLLGLISEGNNEALKILKSFNVNTSDLKQEMENVSKNNNGNRRRINSLPLTIKAETAIREMASEAEALESSKLETEHMLLGFLKNEEDIVTQILNKLNVHYKDVSLFLKTKLSSF